MKTRFFSITVVFLAVFASFVQTAQAQTQPAASETDHRLGVGAYLSAAPGGLVPSVLYNVSDRATVVGTLGLYSSGVTSVMGEVLYRFPQPARADSKVSFEPYVGGGLVVTNVSYGFVGWSVSENFTGVVASGGAFMTVKEVPRWRFSGGLDWVGVDEGVSVAGVGLRVGAHYLF